MKRLKKKFERNCYDQENLDSCKLFPLHSHNIPKLNSLENEKYGIFKIERHWEVNKYVNKELEKYDIEYLYLQENNEWKQVFYNTIYEWEFDVDHGSEYERHGKPLIPKIYVDTEYLFYYLENQEDILYFSTDKYKWFTYIVYPNNRPYYKRIDKLIKFNIPYMDLRKKKDE